MLDAMQIIATTLAAIAMAQSLAHALELPGKMRLPRETYLAVQPIYYPGFTIGGISEPVSILAALALLALLPAGSLSFWLTLAALLCLAIAHGIYWTVTHKVNNFWLKGQQLQGAGAAFFATAGGAGAAEQDWTTLRDRWEYSHVARAVFAMLGLIALIAAAAI